MDPGIDEKLLIKVKGQDGVPGEEKLKDRLWSETKKMWVVAGPAIFTRFSTFGINVISQAFVGHIGATELAAYALVVTVFLRFANGILRTGIRHFENPYGVGSTDKTATFFNFAFVIATNVIGYFFFIRLFFSCVVICILMKLMVLLELIDGHNYRK